MAMAAQSIRPDCPAAELTHPAVRTELRVRFATQADCERLFDLLLTVGTPFPVDHAKAYKAIARVLDEGAVLVVESHGRLVGSMALVSQKAWYSDQSHLADRWLVIDPERHTPGAFEVLVERAMAVAKEAAMPLFLNITTPDRLPAKMRHYRMRGGLLAGVQFYMED